jgi:Tfp pilus assembly protein PilZ
MTMYTRDVSTGGMFVSTGRAFEVGAVLQLDVRHPESDREFALAAIVRRTTAGKAPGIGVEFHEMNESERQRFYEFIHSHIPQIDDLELVDADDPNLE